VSNSTPLLAFAYIDAWDCWRKLFSTS
jgi:hypothetical protein